MLGWRDCRASSTSEASLQHAKCPERDPKPTASPLQPTAGPPPAHRLRKVANEAVVIRRRDASAYNSRLLIGCPCSKSVICKGQPQPRTASVIGKARPVAASNLSNFEDAIRPIR